MTTATATTASPLASFRQGRDEILATILGSVSGLEGSVLEFQNAHEGQVRAARFELSEALREQKRLERLVGDQALELDSIRNHTCAAPAVTDSFGFDLEVPAPAFADPEAETTPAGEPETANADAEAADRTIEELRSSLEELRRTNETLSADLRAEQGITAGLRRELEERDRNISTLKAEAITAGKNLTAAAQTHQDYVRDAEKNFDQRLATGVRTAENGVRVEAVRIIEAIAADNPALTEAVDLFTVAFPAEAEPADQEFIAPAPEIADEAPVSEDDFLHAIPAADPEDGPAPMTQVLPAPDLSEDAILDVNFFNTPQTLEAPAGEASEAPEPDEAPAEAPRPGYGLFGRKKEEQNA